MNIELNIQNKNNQLEIPLAVQNEAVNNNELSISKISNLKSLGINGEINTLTADGLIIINGHFKVPHNTLLKINTLTDCLMSSFALGGEWIFNNEKDYVEETGNKLQYFTKNDEISVEVLEQKTFDFFSIIMSKEFYFNLIDKSNKLHESFVNKITKEQATALSEALLPLNHDMRRIVTDIRNCTRKGYFLRLCIDIKITELLMLQLEQFHNINVAITEKTPISNDDRKKLTKAKEIIDNQYAPPPTISQLALMVGVNENKLKVGFKLLFNTTIHTYALKVRMLRAKDLVKEKKYLIQEIALKLGYKNTSHFSSSYKKYFGYLPTKSL